MIEKELVQYRFRIYCGNTESIWLDLKDILTKQKIKVNDDAKFDSHCYTEYLSEAFEKTVKLNLLILDDCNEKTRSIVTDLRRIKGTILLVTTNNYTLFPDENCMEVRGFSKSEAESFLNEDFDEQLAEQLSFSPLGLRFAKSYMQNHQSTSQEYLKKLTEEQSIYEIEETERQELNLIDEYKITFFTVLRLSIENLKNILNLDHHGLWQVVEMFAYLNPDYIPFWLLKEACQQNCSKNDTCKEVTEIVSILIKNLKKWSIIVLDGNSVRKISDESGCLTIHKVIQLAIRRVLRKDRKLEVLKNVVSVLFPFLRRHIIHSEDFKQNERLTTMLTPTISMICKQYLSDKNYCDVLKADKEFIFKWIHLLDAMAMTFIYKGSVTDNSLCSAQENSLVNANFLAYQALNIFEAYFINEHLHLKSRTEEAISRDYAKDIIKSIQKKSHKAKINNNFIQKLISQKYYEAKDHAIWKLRSPGIPLPDSRRFRITKEKYMEFQKEHGIIPDLSNLVDIYLTELYMSLLYTVGRIYVYLVRKGSVFEQSKSVFSSTAFNLCVSLGNELESMTGIYTMYRERAIIKGIHSLNIQGITKIHGSAKMEILNKVLTESRCIAADKNPVYEFCVLFRYDRKTVCNFEMYSLRLSLDAYIRILKERKLTSDEDYDKDFLEAKQCVYYVEKILKGEELEFLGRGVMLCKMASLMIESKEKKDLEKAVEYLVEAIESEKRAPIWSYSWREALHAYRELAVKLNKTEMFTQFHSYINEFKRLLKSSKTDVEHLKMVEESL